MFGYVRPLRGELRVRELEEYRAVYCGLCRALGRRCGLPARLTLSYDFVFLAMLLAPQDARRMERRRCPLHPFRRRAVCAGFPALDLAADECVILSYRKLRDDAADKGALGGLPARLGARLLRRAYRRAARARPDFDRTVSACLQELDALERERCPSLDRPADAFARILRAAAPGGGEARDRALEQTLYHVGRWIYLLDAWDDREEDAGTGGYNPIAARYPEGAQAHAEDVRRTLRGSRSLAAAGYELAKPQRWDGVLSNILYLGLEAVEELVFSGGWRQARKKL